MTDTSTETALVTPEDVERYLPEALRRPPIFDLLSATPAGQRQLQLIRKRAAADATDSEVAEFLELCAQYALDWNAHEAWCAVSPARDGKQRRILLMVGRNGLRKIAQRQGLDFDGDVVRAQDAFKVTRRGDGTREVFHEYTGAGDDSRGEILGAWCEVFEVNARGDRGRQRGYFYAPLSEYMPTSDAKRRFSPWGAQVSSMIRTAAERQALAQATPLGGIVAPGELDRAEEALELGPAGEPDVEQWAQRLGGDADRAAEVVAMIGRARELGHAGYGDEGTAQMTLSGQSAARVDSWLSDAAHELNELEARQAADAEEVDGELEPQEARPADSAAQGAPAAPDGQSEPSEGERTSEPDPTAEGVSEPRAVIDAQMDEALAKQRAEQMRERANALLDEAGEYDDAGESAHAEELRSESEQLREEADAIDTPAQGSLGEF